jgi:hypothetical protein
MLGEDQGNLVPNASFECGTDGWGSAELQFLPGWYSSLSTLFGKLDPTTTADGHASLKIELTPENQPVAYTDYLHTQSQRITAPLAANIGWIAVKPGCNYAFSVAMKAAANGTPARLVVRQFHGAPIEKPVVLTTEWQRYTLDFIPEAEACYVLAGPELRATEGQPQPPDRATVWLDAVRLTLANVKTPFATRRPLEFGVTTDKPGNIFSWDEPLQFHVAAASSADNQQPKREIALRLTDFFDTEIWQEKLSVDATAGSVWQKDVVLPASPVRRGFMRLEATLVGDKPAETRRMRLAAIPVYNQADSRFGINHAYGWPEQLDLGRKAGLVWVRDWSLKWQDVEPQKGQFAFGESEAEIDRLVRKDFRMLSILGFPSSMWSSSAPATVQPPDPWYYPLTQYPDPERRRDDLLLELGLSFVRCGYAPRDAAEFENYVTQTVNRFKDRVHDWQAFNEPFDTSYSFSAANGYSMADFVRHVELFAKTARKCDPQCRLLGGFILSDPKSTAKRLDDFITAGGLKQLDVLTYHAYPGNKPPEASEPALKEVLATMDRHNIRKPIWFTEFAYFEDDEPWQTPWKHWSPLQANERVQAEYQVRTSVIFFANGVEKLFHHAGLGAGVNHMPLWTMFLRYGNEPFKCYASQAVVSQLLTPTCKFVKRLLADHNVRVYLFSDTNRTVAAVWSTADKDTPALQLGSDKMQRWDIMGRPQTTRTFTPTGSPVFVIGEGMSAEEFEKALTCAP